MEMGRDCEGFSLGDPVALIYPGSFSKYEADPSRGLHLPLTVGEWVYCVHQSGEGRGGEEG